MFRFRFAAFVLWQLAGFEKINALNLYPVYLYPLALLGFEPAANDQGCALDWRCHSFRSSS